MKTTLLQVLPKIAGFSQIRFAKNFQTALLKADKFEFEGVIYFINFQVDNFIDWTICKDLKQVLEYVREYGKDAQVIQVKENGDVFSM